MKHVSSKGTKAEDPQAAWTGSVEEQEIAFHEPFQKCTQSLIALRFNNLFSS